MLTCYVSKELVGEKKNLNGQVVRELGKFIKAWRWTTVLPQQEEKCSRIQQALEKQLIL
jgi:hypothetical protein